MARACTNCIALTCQARCRCTAASSSNRTRPESSGAASRLAASTASWMAKLIPTPATGDMAWAASPMQSRPGRYQRVSRLAWTVSSRTCSQLVSQGVALGLGLVLGLLEPAPARLAG
jgi:hypothetical protein